MSWLAENANTSSAPKAAGASRKSTGSEGLLRMHYAQPKHFLEEIEIVVAM